VAARKSQWKDLPGPKEVTTPPHTLDDLLALVPGMRKMRLLNADTLRVLLDRGRGECTWCGQQVPARRIKWCGSECVQNFQLRCQPAYQRPFVLKREHFICEMCGRDVQASQRRGIDEWGRHPSHSAYGVDWKHKQSVREEIFRRHGWARGEWYEVDHIIPVIEGGGLLGPENLRLLCGACHAVVTRELRARLKQQNG
jgi:hypothetical protein